MGSEQIKLYSIIIYSFYHHYFVFSLSFYDSVYPRGLLTSGLTSDPTDLLVLHLGITKWNHYIWLMRACLSFCPLQLAVYW